MCASPLPSVYQAPIYLFNRSIPDDDKRQLLGQHIWKDILIKPTEGEKEHRSGVFYCVFSTIREVQKEGACEHHFGAGTRRSELSFIRLEADRLRSTLSIGLETGVRFLALFIGYLVHAEGSRVYIVSMINIQRPERFSDIPLVVSTMIR